MAIVNDQVAARAEAFGVLRHAVRLARLAGFRCERSQQLSIISYARSRRVLPPVGGIYSGADWLAPYWLARKNDENKSELESMELTNAETAAFDTHSSYSYVHIERGTPITYQYTGDECEAFTCNSCDERHMQDEARYVVQYSERQCRSRISEAVLCEGCADGETSYCEASDETHFDRNMVRLEDSGVYVSREWAHANAYRSDVVNSYYAELENVPCDEDTCGDCDCNPCECNSGDDDDDGVMYPYGTNILDRLPWPSNVKHTELCFGVEFEMEPLEHSSRKQRELAAALGGPNGDEKSYILSYDGSLDHGVELITLPQTLEQHQKGALVPWKKITSTIAAIAKAGFGTTACGIHIHINRRALKPLQLGKMLVFVNSGANRALVERIAQRSESSWANMSAKKFTDGTRRTSDHYDALGLTSKGTVELRIFRSNTRLDRILKNIEFAHALCLYCRDASMVDVEKPALFTAWITKHRATYPNLAAFLANGQEDAHSLRTDGI